MSAATLQRLPDYTFGFVQLTVPPQRNGNGPGEVFRNRLPFVDVERIDGIPVTTLPRTLIDLASIETDGAKLEVAFDTCLLRGVALSRFEWRLDDLGRRPGIAVIRELVRIRRLSGIPRSPFETRFLRALLRDGLPLPVLQHPVKRGAELIGYIDLAYPEQMVAIELDTRTYHSGGIPFERDPIKQNALMLLGWRMLRITRRRFDADPDTCLAEVREALGILHL